MKNWTFSSIALAGLLLTGTASFAQPAQEGERPGQRRGGQIEREKFQGRGDLVARGKGTAQLKGSGVFSVNGRGQLFVIAPKENIKAEGFAFMRSEGNKHYFEGNGKVRIKGTDVEISLTGDVDALTVSGKGSARLVGVGKFKTKSSKGDWTKAGIDVRFEGGRKKPSKSPERQP